MPEQGIDPPFICPACHAVSTVVRGLWETVHEDDCEWFHGPDPMDSRPWSPWVGTEPFDG